VPCSRTSSITSYANLPKLAPLIIVFTKFDLLIRKVEEDFDIDDDMDEEKMENAIREKAEEEFKRICLRPLQKLFEGSDLPTYTKVSSL
jgi:hypothetical protein